jgi:2'-5' RNA ligase
MDPDSYALWLIPFEPIYEETGKIIAALAKEFSAPAFHPHVTLLGGISGSEKKIVRLCSRLAEVLQPFSIKLTSMDYLADFYRCLFVRVEISEEVKIANAKAKEVFGQDMTVPFLPHLSLLYGSHPPAVKERIIARLGSTLGWDFFVDRFFLVSLAGKPETWNIVKEFPIVTG